MHPFPGESQTRNKRSADSVPQPYHHGRVPKLRESNIHEQMVMFLQVVYLLFWGGVTFITSPTSALFMLEPAHFKQLTQVSLAKNYCFDTESDRSSLGSLDPSP